MLLDQVVDAFHRRGIKFALVGGYAVALHGVVRATIDIDVVLRLRENDFVEAEGALKSLGLLPRLPVTASDVFRFREEYIKNRNLVAWSFFGQIDHRLIVDILITHDYEKMKIVEFKGEQGRRYPVVSINDLIVMKRAAARPRDLADVEALERLKR